MSIKKYTEVKHKKLGIVGFVEGINPQGEIACVTWIDSDYGNFVAICNLEEITCH